MQNAIRLGIIGLGTVGTGVARILQHGADQVAARAGGPLEIARVVVNDPTKKREVDIDPAVLGTDALEVIRDPDIPIIVDSSAVPAVASNRRELLGAAQANVVNPGRSS